MKHIYIIIMSLIGNIHILNGQVIVEILDLEDCSSTESIIFWIPSDDLATYNMAVNGKTGCDYNGLSGANDICNYASTLGGATSFVSAKAGSFVAVLEGDGSAGNPNFYNTHITNIPLYSSNNEIGNVPLTLDDYKLNFTGGSSVDCSRL